MWLDIGVDESFCTLTWSSILAGQGDHDLQLHEALVVNVENCDSNKTEQLAKEVLFDAGADKTLHVVTIVLDHKLQFYVHEGNEPSISDVPHVSIWVD